MPGKRIGLTGLILALAGFGAGCADPAPSPPDAVILVTVDGLIGDELSVFGGPLLTPALQEIADGGRAWADAWTVCPMTRPAAATYLTGVAPDRHGVRDDLFAVLPEAIPTLAGLLAERGYHTAAIPDNSFLGRASGLLREFDVADDPYPIPGTPDRWFPVVRPIDRSEVAVVDWLEAAPAGEPYFLWFHLSRPMIGQLAETYEHRILGGENGEGLARKPGAEAQSDGLDDAEESSKYAKAIERFDATLSVLLRTVEERGELERALIVVAGTQADTRGGDDGEGRGIGFSLRERAVRVPVIAKFPEGTGEPRAADRPVWAPDVARTIADLTGVRLSEDAEGVGLLSDVEERRVRFAWSWAPLDQMGWKALRAATSGRVKRVEGHTAETFRLDDSGPPGQDEEMRLARALADRLVPAPESIALEEIRPLLEARGLTLEPVAEEGRDYGTAEQRQGLSELIWRGRYFVRAGQSEPAGSFFLGVIEADPQNLAAHLDLGHLMVVNRRPKAVDRLERAAELYPGNPEVLHWLAHAIWFESWADAEPLLMSIRSFKLHDADVLYDLACARSLAGDLDASEDYLRRSIEAGYREWSHMESDPDLRNLKEGGRLSEVVREYR